METLPDILIVDDNEENIQLLVTILRKANVNIITALSGTEALEKSQGVELALALLDVRMPGMNGYELAVKLNENRPGDKVPVIFVTAGQFNEPDTFKGYESGAVDYIYKPISPYVLRSKINIFLDLFSQKQIILKDAGLLRESAEVLTRANAVIKEAEDKYRSYVSNAPDGVFVTDETGKYIEVNDSAVRITGYSTEELLNMTIADILTVKSLADGLADFRSLLVKGTSKSDLIFKHKNGTERWWTVEAVRLSENRYLGYVKDITDRKNAEEELKSSLEQLHQLTRYIQEVREKERVAISRELHDDLGQALTAVKIDLGMIRKQVIDEAISEKISMVSILVGDTIKTVQRLTSQLRPQIIDDLGLEAAIEWYTTEYAERNRIQIGLSMDAGISITPVASLVIFRIMQESLTNIARHAQATLVEIELHKNDNFLMFRICDNGIGISEKEIHSKKSFGIISMMERTASLGGVFEIGAEKGGGTRIELTLPLNQSETNENIDL